MRLLLDADCLIAALRGDAETVDSIERAEEVWIPFVVLAEIKAGFCGRNAGRSE